MLLIFATVFMWAPFIVCCSLAKDVKDRPYYPDLLDHPLIREYEVKEVNVGQWFKDICATIGPL